MPKITGPDGVEKEISMEEFQEMMRSGDAQVIGIQQVITDQKTGKVVNKYNIPRNPDGSFDLFGGSMFGAMFGDHRSLEEKIADGESGDEDTMEALAQLYLNGGLEADKDPEKAVYWFGKLAECGNSIAQFNLGLLYAKGHGVARDFTKAAYWMEQAAKNGDTDALPLVEKYRKAEAAQKKLPTGDAQAQADLAGVLMSLAGALEQTGKEKDYAEAFELAQKSAAQNNGDGLWALALAYQHGRGVEQNEQKAIECYRKGAELGHAPSQHSLACAYRCGDGVEENKALAIELCRKSAAQGYVLAEMFLAKVYETGDGVEADPEQMLAWGEKAAAHGAPDIQYEVAKLYMYQRDDGKMIDAQRARYWLTQAAERGHEMAGDMLNFPPVWAEEGIRVEGSDGGNDPMEAPMFRLFGIAMEYGLEEAMEGEEPTFEAVIAFVTALADSGNTEARDALDEFQSVLTMTLGEPEAVGDSLVAEAEGYLEAMRTQFHTQCWEWEQYPDEVYYRIKEIMSRNVKSLEDIEKNKPMVDRYMEGVKQEIYRKRDQFYQSMQELEEKLTYFRDKGLDGETMDQLIEHFVQWVDYCRELPFRIGKSGGSFAIPEVFLEKKRQWLGEEAEAKPAEAPEPAAKEESEVPAAEETPPVDVVSEIRRKRKADMERTKRGLEDAHRKESSQAAKEYEDEKNRLLTEQKKTNEEIEWKTAQMNRLGIFKRAEKKMLRSQVEALCALRDQYQSQIDRLREKYEKEKAAISEKTVAQLEQRKKEIFSNFYGYDVTVTDAILLGMEPGKKYPLSEILEFPGMTADCNNQTMSQKYLPALTSQSKLKRIMERGKVYFMLQ